MVDNLKQNPRREVIQIPEPVAEMRQRIMNQYVKTHRIVNADLSHPDYIVVEPLPPEDQKKENLHPDRKILLDSAISGKKDEDPEVLG